MSQIALCKKRGLINVQEDMMNILMQRSKIDCKDIENICLHHNYILNTGYSLLQKRCSNPLKLHSKTITKSLKIIKENDYEASSFKSLLVIGDKVCTNCWNKLFTNSTSFSTEKFFNEPCCSGINVLIASSSSVARVDEAEHFETPTAMVI